MDAVGQVVPSRIPGVLQIPLTHHVDERGAVLHMLRSDAPHFTRFGEVYFSLTNPGVAKAWKRHLRMTQLFAVPVGQIRLVLFDDRPPHDRQPILEEHVLGLPERYVLFRIPPGVWYGFQAVSSQPAMIANCADLIHDPTEVERLDLTSDRIPFAWK
jgi:dTDP-4-dehydrorhamnose 3,5-epimerase